MENVVIDNFSMSHPSIFQTKDWSSTPTYQFSENDLPLTKKIVQTYYSLLKPVIPSTSNSISTLLFYTFFSEHNLKVLNKQIIDTVYKWSKHMTCEQSQTTLVQLMEYIYENNARNIDEYTAPKSITIKHIKAQIIILNGLVIDKAVPIIIDGIQQHLAYLDQVDKPKVVDRPVFDDSYGTYEYRTTDQIK